MFKKTALFIYLFKEKKLEELLEEQFVEQLGIIETIGEMYLDPETEFQLNYLFEKDLPAFLNNYCQSNSLSIKEMEDNLSKQAKAIKEIILSIYINSSELLKKDMEIQLKVLNNRNKSIQQNLGTYQQIQTNDFTENNITKITLSELEDFKTKGLKILQENKKNATWQNDFKSSSDTIIANSISPVKENTINKLKNENISNEKNETSQDFPFINILITLVLIGAITSFLIILSLIIF